jgi:hypothetical protein
MTEIPSLSNLVFGQSRPTSVSGWEQLGRSVVSWRVDRLSLLRRDSRNSSITSAPQHLDANLLKERQALDDAWARELTALIAMKRARTPDAIETAEAARTDTARVVTRIETTRAMTLDGLKVKARAALWRRHGEPLPHGSLRSLALAESDTRSYAP